jgi:anti-sigma B factor antagonist
MQIKEIEEEVHYTIQIFGDVDAASSINLDKAFDKALSLKKKKILIDCTNLDYIASAGLGVFISYIEPFKENNINFILFGLNPKVKDVFTILGLDKLLKIEDTKEAAKTHL